MSPHLGNYTLDQLVDIITREVLAAYPVGGDHSCGVCSQAHCDGQCVQTNPDGARRVVSAGADRLSTRLGVKNIAADLAGMIDHTLLKPQASEEQFRQLCAEAREFKFATVCVNPAWVPLCSQLLIGSGVKVCTVIGFPLGATLPEVKAFESQRCITLGASELDMVINIGALKSRQYRLVEEDIAAVVSACHAGAASVKVIIEAAYLTDEEKVEACALAKAAGADYVKTSTGFGPSGATVDDVALMRRVVGPEMGVKAAGGVRNAEEMKAMIAAGATRIGASAGVKIVGELKGTIQPAPSTPPAPAGKSGGYG
jgi:deoxyribose-phosphate aldolase